MALYHLSAKPISRAAGRSATGAAAYRAGELIVDARTGLVHDYTHKGGVLHTELVLPGGGRADRAEFWNRLEAHHKRGDAVLAREVEVSLPRELGADERRALAVSFARELADRYGVAADVALHAPRRISDRELEKHPDQHVEIDPVTGHRHNGNWHAHILLSACTVAEDGTLGKKAVALDPIHCQRHKLENMADRERGRWAELTNAALERHGHHVRVDHRSHAERGIDRAPTQHLGPAAAGWERRSREPSRKRAEFEREVVERLGRAKRAGELERQAQAIERSIIDTTGDLRAALGERDRLRQEGFKKTVADGVSAFMKKFEAHQQDQRVSDQAQEQAHQQEQVRQREQQANLERQREIAIERERERERQRKLGRGGPTR